MNGKLAKKVRKLHQRDAHLNMMAQANYLRTALKPCPKAKWVFRLWRFGARFYFTQNHIEEVTKSYERLTQR